MNFMCVRKNNNAKLVTSIIGKVSKKSTPKSNLLQYYIKLTQYGFHLQRIKYSMNTKYGFSILEVLLAIFVLGILGVSLMKSISALKAQNYKIQHFLVTNASLFETQLFINRHLSSIKPESIIIAPNNISWEQYDKLFIDTDKGEYMDFSLNATKANLTLQNDNLYFNNAILLHNVKSMQFIREEINSHDILSYRICSTNICIADSIILEKVRQKMPTIKTGI